MAHPTTGFYVKDGYEYVSQSTVIGETDEVFNPGKVKGLEIWRQTDEDWEKVLIDSQERGTILHKEIELALGLELAKTDQVVDEDISFNADRWMELEVPQYMEHLLPFVDEMQAIKKLSNKEHEYIVEEESFSERFGFACTKDIRAWVGIEKRGRDYFPSKDPATFQHAVLDWKTVRTPKEGKELKPKPRSYHSDNFLQLGANALAHNEEVKNGKDAPKITLGIIVAFYAWRAPRLHVVEIDELRQNAKAFLERLEYYKQTNCTNFPRKCSQ
jgi:hypothetical protein